MIERVYTIPLRRGTMKAPRTRRAKKAIFVLKDFITKHLKSSDISLSEKLNEHIWQNGMRNPIMKVTVAVVKDDKNKISVRLVDEPKAEAKKTDAKSAKKVEKPAVVDTKATEVKAEEPKAEEKPASEKPKKAPAKKAEKTE